MMSFTLRSETDELMVCRGCLAIDVKLYNIQENSLVEPYEELIGFPLLSSRKQYLCGFCHTHLLKFAKFRARCRKAEELLVNAEMQGICTPTYIEELSRRYIDFKPNYIKTYIEYINIESKCNIKEELIPNTEVKTAVFIDETDVGIAKEEIDSDIEMNEPLCMFVEEFGDHNTDHEDSSKDSAKKTKEMSKKTKETSKKTNHLDEFEDDVTNYKDSSKVRAKKSKEMSKKPNIKNFLEEMEDDDTDTEDSSKVRATKSKEMSKKPNNIKDFLEEFEDDDTSVSSSLESSSSDDDFSKVRAKKSKEISKKPNNINNFVDVESKENNVENASSKRLKICGNAAKENLKDVTKTHKKDNIFVYDIEKKTVIGNFEAIHLTKDEQIYEIKLKTNQKNACKECGKKYKNLIKHNTKHHNKEYVLKCEICKICFNNKKQLKKHREEHEKKYICKNCNYTTQLTDNLQLHKCRKITAPVKLVKDFAKFNFEVEYLTIEEQIKEIDDKRKSEKKNCNGHKCEYCGKNYTTKKTLENHFQKSHAVRTGDYVCDICKTVFKNKCKLRIHLRNHGMRFLCKECDFIGKRSYDLRAHYEWHSGKRYTCTYCDQSFTKKTTYFTHVRLIHASELNWCEYCGESFIGKRGLHQHKQLAHKQIETTDNKCAKCNKNFLDDNALKNHINLNSCDLFNCVKCGDAFVNEFLLKYHLIQHNNINYECKKCNVRFLNMAAYDKHEGSCGSGHVCMQCGENYETGILLNDHVNTEHTVQIFKCEQCDRTYSNAYYYREHISKAHKSGTTRSYTSERKKRKVDDQNKFEAKRRGRVISDSLRKWKVVDEEGRNLVMEKEGLTSTNKTNWTSMCEVCGKSFQNNTLMRYHQRLHTGEKVHRCTECPKYFLTTQQLMEHMRVHTGERPFSCNSCSKAFKTNAALYRHNLMHTDVRRHVCQICDKTFRTSTCVKTHIKTVHMKLPMPPRIRPRR